MNLFKTIKFSLKEGTLWGEDSEYDEKYGKLMHDYIEELIKNFKDFGWSYDDSSAKYGHYRFSKDGVDVEYCDNFDKIGTASIDSDFFVGKVIPSSIDKVNDGGLSDDSYIMLDFKWSYPSAYSLASFVNTLVDNNLHESSFCEADGKISLQESDVDWKAVVDKIYKYINYEYNEIGSDDRYFLNNIIKSAVGTDKDTAKQLEKAKREEDKAKQAEKDRLAKQKADREAKGITTYSLRGKKRDVLNSLESNLGKDFYVKEPGIDGILTIRRNDSNSGIRAYLQNKNLPDDVFGLVFEPVISKKISPRMQPIYDLSVGDYKTEIGSLGEFTGKEFKLTDIPKLTDTIKKVLSTEEV